ncbi:DUF6928 family protein [Gordonia sp. MP11Mi]|uniref:Uncharacterized protein n=1 Tax=Gordonia sp. MP11Mi TaxID=3022769 RepID=A0AA97CW00_9ACTN
MFANTTTLWFVACPDPAEQLRRGSVADPDRTDDLMRRAYVDDVPSATAITDLSTLTDADDDVVFAAHFGDVAVLAGRSLATVSPDEMTTFVTGLEPGWTVLLLSLDPTTNTGVFARWEDGRLQRAFAASPDTIHADHGVPFPFESPFWAGERPLQYLPGAEADPLDLPFHPAELAEEANRQWLGFRFTPPTADGDTVLTGIPVFSYRILSEGAEATAASQVQPATVPVPEELGEVTSETGGATGAIDGASTEVTDSEVTTPLAVTTPPGPDPVSKAPGPISRFFGFRGRL